MDADDYFKDFKLADYTFIVISNRTKYPLTWVFPYTQAITDVTVGKHLLKNWRNIVPELYSYLEEEHDVPIGIHSEKSNNIIDWLENEGEN